MSDIIWEDDIVSDPTQMMSILLQNWGLSQGSNKLFTSNYK